MCLCNYRVFGIIFDEMFEHCFISLKKIDESESRGLVIFLHYFIFNHIFVISCFFV